MSKKIFFIVLTCCLLVATFCVSFAGAPQVQSAPADIRALLDRPDCASASLIVPPVVDPLNDIVSASSLIVDVGYNIVRLDGDSFDSPGLYGLEIAALSSIDSSYYLYNPEDAGFMHFVGFYNLPDDVDFVSSYSLFQFVYSSVPIYLVEYSSDSSTNVIEITFTDINEVVTVISFVSPPGFSTTLVFQSVAPFELSDASFSYISSVTSDFGGIFTDIIGTLMSGLRALGTNVGRAFSTMANAIFINADGTGLSTFGILVVVFAAISLGLSLTRWVLNFVTSWGNRNR